MSSLDLLQGTLDLLILKALSWGPAHGYGVARSIERITGDSLTIGEGSLYPALHRLEARGAVESEWRVSDRNRKAKFYRLTPQGRKALRREVAEWGDFVMAVGKVLRANGRPGAAEAS
jgi:transcriptional regulator